MPVKPDLHVISSGQSYPKVCVVGRTQALRDHPADLVRHLSYVHAGEVTLGAPGPCCILGIKHQMPCLGRFDKLL